MDSETDSGASVSIARLRSTALMCDPRPFRVDGLDRGFLVELPAHRPTWRVLHAASLGESGVEPVVVVVDVGGERSVARSGNSMRISNAGIAGRWIY